VFENRVDSPPPMLKAQAAAIRKEPRMQASARLLEIHFWFVLVIRSSKFILMHLIPSFPSLKIKAKTGERCTGSQTKKENLE
jgi:hypothetical protein